MGLAANKGEDLPVSLLGNLRQIEDSKSLWTGCHFAGSA
jgi:hypothetical protein